MEKSYQIVAVLDCIMISELLISTVALIHRIEQHVNIERKFIALADPMTALKRLVARTIVDDKDVDIIGFGQSWPECGVRL